MNRVVADTNVLISGLLFGGLPSSFLALALAGKFSVATSATLLDELEEKLLFKFDKAEADVGLLRRRFENAFEVVSTRPTLSVIKDDPDDDRVLECGVAAGADYIVSGDRHLLSLGSFEGISIITVRQFMDRIAPAA